MRKTRFWPVVVAVLAAASVLAAQEAPKPAPGPAKEVLQSWNSVGKKLIDMAEDFPADKYDYKPTPEVRSFAEILLHVAGANYLFIDSAQGEKMGGEDLSHDKYKTKDEIVAVLKKCYADGAAQIEQEGDAAMSEPIKHPFGNRMISHYGFWMAAIEHAGEHYGNLVTYYRLNDMVPPASRH